MPTFFSLHYSVYTYSPNTKRRQENTSILLSQWDIKSKLNEKSETEDRAEDADEEAKALSLLILLKTAPSHAPAQMIEDYLQHRVKHIVGWIYSSTTLVAYSICASCHHARWILRMDSYCCSVLGQVDKTATHPMLPGLVNPRQPSISSNCINCNPADPQITGGWLQLLSCTSQQNLGCAQCLPKNSRELCSPRMQGLITQWKQWNKLQKY